MIGSDWIDHAALARYEIYPTGLLKRFMASQFDDYCSEIYDIGRCFTMEILRMRRYSWRKTRPRVALVIHPKNFFSFHCLSATERKVCSQRPTKLKNDYVYANWKWRAIWSMNIYWWLNIPLWILCPSDLTFFSLSFIAIFSYICITDCIIGCRLRSNVEIYQVFSSSLLPLLSAWSDWRHRIGAIR